MTMPRTRADLDRATADTEAMLDKLDPSTTPPSAVDDVRDLRRIGVALQEIDTAQDALRSAVATARDNGRSWTEIANILGVSRQAARQRFADEAEDSHHAIRKSRRAS